MPFVTALSVLMWFAPSNLFSPVKVKHGGPPKWESFNPYSTNSVSGNGIFFVQAAKVI